MKKFIELDDGEKIRFVKLLSEIDSSIEIIGNNFYYYGKFLGRCWSSPNKKVVRVYQKDGSYEVVDAHTLFILKEVKTHLAYKLTSEQFK